MTNRFPPTFSVIVPWHGNMAHLRRSLKSIRAQTLAPLETLVVANGPALALLPSLSADPEFSLCRFVSCTTPDASRARNAGIDAARGDWLAFLDVDDAFLPGKLARLAEEIVRGQADAFISRGLRVRSATLSALYPPQLLQDGEKLGDFFFSRGANCCSSAIVVRRSLAKAVRFLDDFRRFEDTDFLIRAQHQGARVSMIPEPLYHWHDETEIGRLSLDSDYGMQIAWAGNLRSILGERAYFAFLARRVGQHMFPGAFLAAGAMLWNGWLRGGIPARETALFAIRGFLPRRLVRSLISLRSRLEGTVAARRLQTGRNADA